MPSPSMIISLLATSLIGYTDATPVNTRSTAMRSWKSASGSCDALAAGKALYLQSNDKPNHLISIPIALDGTLYGGSAMATGGMGGDEFNAMTGMGNAPDALGSQSPVYVAGDYVFVVNAGSSTVTQFKVSNTNTTLTRLGQSTVPGDFPVTVTASEKLGLACVGYTGAQAGVACAEYSAHGLAEFKPLTTFALNQTTPPSGPLNGVSQISFAANDTRLVTNVKGDGTANNTGFVSVIPVSCDGSFGAEMRSSPNGTAVLFGGVGIPQSTELFVTDASFGAVVLDLDAEKDVVTLKGKKSVPGQKATCWAAYSAARESVFVTDAAVNRLVEISQDGEKIVSMLELKNGDPGLTEVQVSGRFVYALSPGNGTTEAAITVVDSFRGKQVQHFGLGMLGVGKTAAGLALLH